MRRTLSMILIAAMCQAAGAQSVPQLGEVMEVAIVNVDVVVSDAKGRRVRGLTRDDFEVYENGTAQPITHFAEYADDAAETQTGVEVQESPRPEQRRSLVLFLEPFHGRPAHVAPFIESLKNLVRETIRAGDSVSLVVFDSVAEARLEATDDVAAVEEELDLFAEELLAARADRSAGVANDVAQMMEFEKEGSAMAAGKGLKRAVTSGETIAANVARSAAMIAEFEMRRRVAAINAVVNGLAGVEGKKVLILAAHRLGSFSGAEFFFAAGSAIASGVEKGTVSRAGVSERFLASGSSIVPAGEADNLDNRKRVRELIANANAAGVSIYPIFPSGLDDTPVDPSVPDTTRQVLANEMGMRQEIATQTGGLTTYGATGIVRLLPEIAGDLSNYYSLAYRVPATGQDRARDLVVRVKRPGLRVRTRTQFVEKSDESRMRDRIVAAMYGMVSESPIRIEASLGAPKSGGLRKTLPLSVRVPISALTLVPQDSKHAGAFSVFVMTGAAGGEVSEITRRTQPFEVPAEEVSRATAGHFTYDVEIVVNKGADHVVVGVLDEVSKEYGIVRLDLS